MKVKELKAIVNSLPSSSDESDVMLANDIIVDVEGASLGLYDINSDGEVWDFPNSEFFGQMTKISSAKEVFIISSKQ